MKTICTLILFTLLAISSAHAGTLSASADRTELKQNETLNLTVQYDDDPDDEEPDTQALEQHFTILGRNRSASIQIINGKASRSTTWQFELMPRKPGTLLIPSFSIRGDFSEAITIEVSKGMDPGTRAGQDLFTETAIDRQQVYVQQQAVISWRLVSRVSNISDPQFLPPKIDNVLVQDLGSRSYQRSAADGALERVIEQRYALFPQQSGSVTIPPQQFQVVVNSMRRSSRGIIHPAQDQVRLRTNALQLDVLPAVPASNSAASWLPAARLDISQEITGTDSSGRVTAGTAFTRVVTLRAEGLSAEQLPAIDLATPGTRQYPESPALHNEPGDDGVIGRRQQRAAVIATASGELLLPEVRVPWYDTHNNEWREAVLSAKTLTVLPAAGSSAAAAPAPPASQDGPTSKQPLPTTASPQALVWWQVSTAVLALLLAACGFWILRLQRQTARANAGQQKNLQADEPRMGTPPAAGADLATLHRNLLAWGRQHPSHAAALADPSVAPLLNSLAKHLYGNGPAPDSAVLSQLPQRLASLATALAASNATAPQQLDQLYR